MPCRAQRVSSFASVPALGLAPKEGFSVCSTASRPKGEPQRMPLEQNRSRMYGSTLRQREPDRLYLSHSTLPYYPSKPRSTYPLLHRLLPGPLRFRADRSTRVRIAPPFPRRAPVSAGALFGFRAKGKSGEASALALSYSLGLLTYSRSIRLRCALAPADSTIFSVSHTHEKRGSSIS